MNAEQVLEALAITLGSLRRGATISERATISEVTYNFIDMMKAKDPNFDASQFRSQVRRFSND